MRRLFAVLILAGVAWAFQGPLPIPPCQGVECLDDTWHRHDGMPTHCQNLDTPAWKANCKCERDCEETFATGCVRECMKKGCLCDHGCDSR